MPKFASKVALIAYFRARIFKHYCHIWNQHTPTVNSGVGSTCCNGVGSALSECPASGMLYKVCPAFSLVFACPVDL